MKKTAFAMALAIGITGAYAQDLTSSKGEKYLPEANDWAIGFDAMPVINMFGHMVSNSTNGNSTTYAGPQMSGTYGSQTIVGKLFLDDKTAIRAMLGINTGSTTYDYMTNDVTYTGTGTAPQVTDTWKHSVSQFSIGGGIEKRRGSTRLQGYYGAMLELGFGNPGSDTYTYGNSLSSTYLNHVSNFTPANYGTEAPTPPQYTGELTYKSGNTFMLGVNGFIGVEYFIVPKISLGAEYMWGVYFESQGQGSTSSETWAGGGVATTSLNTGGAHSFNIGNSVGNPLATGVGNVVINFHF
jgi:hypothetical protein